MAQRKGVTWRKQPEKPAREIVEDITKERDLVKVCFPEHYKTQGVYWRTVLIPRRSIEGFRAMHPGMEIVGEDIDE